MIGKGFVAVSYSRRELRAGDPMNAHYHLPVFTWAPIKVRLAERSQNVYLASWLYNIY